MRGLFLRILRPFVAGLVVTAGVSVVAAIYSLLARVSVPAAICWALLIVGTVLLAVSALLLMGRSPSTNLKGEADRTNPLATAAALAKTARSKEREALAGTGMRLFVVGVTVIGCGFLVSALFRV